VPDPPRGFGLGAGVEDTKLRRALERDQIHLTTSKPATAFLRKDALQ
jgi:hypothetical protein